MYLWKLLDKLKDYKLTQVAGFEGLNRNIRWFHIAEDETLSNFIIGDELVFTTGVKMNGNSVALLGFVKAMLKYGAGGIVINTGKYINEIPQELKDFCNANRLPLFEMPWEIRLVDVGKASSTAILEDERFSVNFRNAVNTALFLPEFSKDSFSLFSEYGFSEEMNYVVLAISSKNDEIKNLVNECISSLNSIAFVTSVGGDVVVILGNKNSSVLFGEATAMQGKIKTMALCGVSDVFKGISNLSKGYHSAQTNKISGKANARKILGNNKIIGATARTYERAVTAVSQGADYLGIGAMFDTSTKSGTTHMTKELSQKITSYANIPVVGIGGINSENIMSLEGYGIDGVAVVSAIFKSEDIEKSAKIMKEKASKIVRES